MTAIPDRGIAHQAAPTAWKKPLCLIAIVLGWTFFLYWGTVSSMVGIWERSETFAHGFLVLPISLWLVWRNRGAVAEETPRLSLKWVWVQLTIGFAWLLGELASVNAMTQLAWVGLMVTSIPALLGERVARKLAFPLGFLVFAVPMGEFLTPILMDWTAKFAVLGLRASGVPVYQEGLEFVIPSGNWSVVEACSGIRYLIASVMVGTLFAYLNFRSLQRRLAFIAVSMAVPILANWVRAYGIVMIGHLSGNRLATGVDHLVYGWLFFGLVVTLLFFIGARWAETGAVVQAGRPGHHGAGLEPDFPAAGAAMLVALVVALPVMALQGIDKLNSSNAPNLEKDVASFAAVGWQAVEDPVAPWRPSFKDAADSWHQTFKREGQTVSLHIGYYRNQGSDGKLPLLSILVQGDDGFWNAVPQGGQPVNLGASRLTANGVELRPRSGPGPVPALVAWQWYWAGGIASASANRARMYSAWSRLLGRGDDRAVIVLSSAAPGAAGQGAMEAFTRSAGTAITQLLNQTRNRR